MLAIARIVVNGSLAQQAACLLLCAFIVYVLQRIVGLNDTRSRLPPVEKGWMPWLGVAIKFGKNPM